MLFWANSAEREKIVPLVLGKSKMPRYLKNIKDCVDANNNVWLMTKFFIRWQCHEDVKTKKFPIHRLMSFATTQYWFFGKYKNLFHFCKLHKSPSDYDLGLIKNSKILHKKQLVQLVVQTIEEPNPKKIVILNAMSTILLAWSQVTKTTKKYCFIKVGLEHRNSNGNESGDVSDDNDTIINEDDRNVCRAETTIDEYMDCDEDVITVSDLQWWWAYQEFPVWIA